LAGPFHQASAAPLRADKLAKTSLFESPRMFCDVYALQPGQEQAGHVHADSDKVYAVVEGRCRVSIGAEARVLGAGEVAIAAPGVAHGLLNDSGAPCRLLVFMAPHPSFKA
jgi:quercetin dioxygenase-like cupin family protein